MLDRAWEGAPASSGSELESTLETSLERVGLLPWARAIVIDPELEAWVFSDSQNVALSLGWLQGMPDLREALVSRGLWNREQTKPADPKAALIVPVRDIFDTPDTQSLDCKERALSFQKGFENMEMDFSTRRLLLLRRLTRAVSESLRGQVRGYLGTLAPILRPRTVFGEHVQSNVKEVVRGSEKAFKDLQAVFDGAIREKPFNLQKGLTAPFEVESTAIETTPFEYRHVARDSTGSKSIQVTSPLKWVLSYSGFGVNRLRDLLADRNRTADEVFKTVLHLALVNSVFVLQPHVVELMSALHFTVTTEKWPEFGSLPITCLTTSVSTVRPPDDVIIESTEISGSDVFEEVINTADLANIADPYRDKLHDIAAAHDPNLVPKLTVA